jgi:hypothetical protein
MKAERFHQKPAPDRIPGQRWKRTTVLGLTSLQLRMCRNTNADPNRVIASMKAGEPIWAAVETHRGTGFAAGIG